MSHVLLILPQKFIRGISLDSKITGFHLSAARVGDVHRARACRLDREGREASDGWAEAQCQAAVPLTGVAGLSAARTGMGRGRAVARTRVGRPEKKGSWAARMHSTVLDFFELV
jgi:hypothetical protein